MKLIKPVKLALGDRVGVISPSSSIKLFPRRLKRGVGCLQNDLRVEVVLGKHINAEDGYSAGTVSQRVADIHDFFRDQSIKAIFCSSGGYSANALLDHLDYSLIKNNPKVFIGFSDITVLTNAITKMTGLITFHGPTILPSFGSFEGLNLLTRKSLVKIIQNTDPAGNIIASPTYSEESLFWDKEDNRPSVYKTAVPYTFLCKAGIVEGLLFGGNINTFGLLVGTKYLPNLKDSILFLEDGDANFARIERDLWCLEQAKIFSQIKGLLIGRFVGSEKVQSNIFAFFSSIGKKYNIPIVINLDIGHTKPIITLPIGGKIRIDSVEGIVTIVESMVI